MANLKINLEHETLWWGVGRVKFSDAPPSTYSNHSTFTYTTSNHTRISQSNPYTPTPTITITYIVNNIVTHYTISKQIKNPSISQGLINLGIISLH